MLFLFPHPNRDYAGQVRDMYAREDCWPVGEKCSEEEMVNRVMVNPIYNYQAIKRLVVYFKEVEKTLGSVDIKSEWWQMKNSGSC